MPPLVHGRTPSQRELCLCGVARAGVKLAAAAMRGVLQPASERGVSCVVNAIQCVSEGCEGLMQRPLSCAPRTPPRCTPSSAVETDPRAHLRGRMMGTCPRFCSVSVRKAGGAETGGVGDQQDSLGGGPSVAADPALGWGCGQGSGPTLSRCCDRRCVERLIWRGDILAGFLLDGRYLLRGITLPIRVIQSQSGVW
jgi:hypothetical protein